MNYLLHSPTELAIAGDVFSPDVKEIVDATFGKEPDFIPQFPLVICDPPYGDIVKEKWDKKPADYLGWFDHCAEVCSSSGTIAMWGGVGKPGNRPFVKFAAEIEDKRAGWRILNWITWSKKRAYGVQDNYLFTREECLILVREKAPSPYTFNIPLLETKRGYAGYSKDYPAKSEFLRRTNVWMDINELFSGKIHPTQKPDTLYEVLIATHSHPGDVVYDPCAGSGTTARAAKKLGRGWCIVEKEAEYLQEAKLL